MLICRGYYIRAKVLEHVVINFLNSVDGPKQVNFLSTYLNNYICLCLCI